MKFKDRFFKKFLAISFVSFLFITLMIPILAAGKDEYRSHWWTTKDMGEIHLTGYENEVTGEVFNADWYKVTRGTATFCCTTLSRPSKYVATLTYSAGYNGYIYVVGTSFSI